MNFDLTTFAFQIVNVLVLLAILRHFLFKPVVEIIARRQADTQAAMAKAAQARAEAEAATEAAKSEAEATRAARHDVLAKAQAEAEAERTRLVAAAQAEARHIAEAAQTGADKLRAEAQTGLVSETRDLAQAIAARAMAAQPHPPTVSGYLDRLVTSLAAMPEALRQTLLAAHDLTLLAPVEPDPAELDTIRQKLSGAGARADLPLSVDPALIAGLELRSGAGVVRNSLAHDLDQIAKAMRDGTEPRD